MNIVRRVGFNLALLLASSLLSVEAIQAQDRPLNRPERPENLRVTNVSGVTTAQWDPVAEATRYVLRLEAAVDCNGRRQSSELWTFATRGAPTSLPFPDEFVRSGTPVQMTLTAYKSPIGSSPGLSNRIEYTPPGDPASTRSCRSGSNNDDRGWDGIPIGAMGQIFREEGDRLKVYEAVSATQGVLVLDVSQTEVDEVLAATNNGICVKTSANLSVVLYVLPNQDLLISMGPNPQGKIVHTELEGGLQGAVISTVTTLGEMPPGVGCMTVMPLW